MRLVWPGAFLDLAVRLHEPFIFQAFFANENSFPPAKKLFIKKIKNLSHRSLSRIRARKDPRVAPARGAR